jgi:hypothetical protein
VFERIEDKALGLDEPSLADDLIWGEAVEGLEAATEFVSGDDAGEMVLGDALQPLAPIDRAIGL